MSYDVIAVGADTTANWNASSRLFALDEVVIDITLNQWMRSPANNSPYSALVAVGAVGGGSGGTVTGADNGNGTYTITTSGGSTVVDNGNGTVSITP